jgi:hypothetical protein
MIRDALGLSKEAIERRRGYVMAGDAPYIMRGECSRLVRIKLGRAAEEDIGDKLNVINGSFSEPLNLTYCEEQTGREITYYTDNPTAMLAWHTLHGRNPAKDDFVHQDEFVVCEKHPHMAAHLDGMWISPKFHKPGVIDAKHVGQFRYDELTERYTWAMTHQAIVCDVDCWALSVFVGNNRWELIEQEVDPFAREELIEAEAEFWDWVRRGEEPIDAVPVVPPKPQPRLRSIEMPGIGGQGWVEFVAKHNWSVDVANAAEQFTATLAAHNANGAARTAIKDALPEDVGALSCPTQHGLFSLKRATSGALTMTGGKSDG